MIILNTMAVCNFKPYKKIHLILYRNQKILSVAAEINILINNAI